MGNFANVIPIRPVDQPDEENKEKNQEVDFDNRNAKEAWTSAFIKEDGFKSVVDALINWDCKEETMGIFDLKQLNFMITLVRIFLISAFSS
jgi:hypothetical protein